MQLECYAQRLLNQFRGVMNIIAYQGAEAVTTDGVHWDIYVRDTELVQDLANSNRVQTSDIRYGSWSARQGLKRGALYPSDDFKVLEHRGAIVYEHLLNQHRQVPFPLTDAFELWLLDSNDRPLAICASPRNRPAPPTSSFLARPCSSSPTWSNPHPLARGGSPTRAWSTPWPASCWNRTRVAS